MTQTTTLETLRQYPGWQDKGELGEDDGLTDELEVTIGDDGSVNVTGEAGVLVYADDVTDEWLSWLRAQGLLQS